MIYKLMSSGDFHTRIEYLLIKHTRHYLVQCSNRKISFRLIKKVLVL